MVLDYWQNTNGNEGDGNGWDVGLLNESTKDKISLSDDLEVNQDTSSDDWGANVMAAKDGKDDFEDFVQVIEVSLKNVQTHTWTC